MPTGSFERVVFERGALPGKTELYLKTSVYGRPSSTSKFGRQTSYRLVDPLHGQAL